MSAPLCLSAGHMPMQGSCLKQRACWPPANLRGRDNYCHQDPGYPAARHQEPQPHQKMFVIMIY